MKHAGWQRFKGHREEHSTCPISRSWPADGRLSAKAKGLMIYIFTRLEREVVTFDVFIAAMRDGAKSVRSGLRELRALGYAQLVYVRGRKGQIIGTEWTFYEHPIFKQSSNNVTRDRDSQKGHLGRTEIAKRGISLKGNLGESLLPDLQ